LSFAHARGRSRSRGPTYDACSARRGPRRPDGERRVDEPSLLSGNLTVVGKVVYRDLTRRDGTSCGLPVPGGEAHSYIDRQTISLFAPALQTAPQSILDNLGLVRAQILTRIQQSATFPSPVVVVVPVAIYQ